MQIRLLRPFYLIEKRFDAGSVVELSEQEALTLIEEGSAISESGEFSTEGAWASAETPEKRRKGRKS
jgi:hypothetical protein